uniref:ATP synthase subunit a n=1 Tax=Theloderma albopunctatum TaxID=1775700 RepID=A0AAU6S658_9NEOB
MMAHLFNQFSPPTLLGVSLITMALVMPWLIMLTPSNRWVHNRLTSFQSLLMKSFTKHIFTVMKKPAHNWAPLLTTLMTFLLGLNLLGLFPYTFTPTTQLSTNLGLAIPLWLTTVIIGLRNQPSSSLAHLLPEGTPTPLIPILILIETISLLIRPMALGVRLTANLIAGHLLIQLSSSATMIMISTLPSVSLLTFILLLLLTMLEIAVAMIQAYVFVLLLSLYLQENT